MTRTQVGGKCVLAAPFVIAALAIALQVAPDVVAQPESEQLWRARTLGRARFETPSEVAQAPAELKKAVELAPGSFADQFNYGIGLLRAGDIPAAITELQRAQRQNPQSPYTYFNLGIAYKRLRRVPEAIAQFERMVQLAPQDAASHYNLGYLYEQADRLADGMREYEAAARLDPLLVAPRFAIFNQYRLGGDAEKTAVALAAFRKTKEMQQASGFSQDADWSIYAEILDPLQPPAANAEEAPRQPAKTEVRTLPGTVDAATAGTLLLDADGDGRTDLLVWSKTGVLLFRQGAARVAASGLDGLTGVTSIAAGDFDNDGLPDLCILTGGGPLLFHNAGGRFERSPTVFPAGSFTRAVWLDFDHDYDLDILLFGERSVLLRNTGAGFEDYTAHFPFASGSVTAAAAFRSVPDSRGVDLAVSYRNGGSVLYRDRLAGVFERETLAAMPAEIRNEADFDGDGRPDRVQITSQGRIRVLLDRSGAASRWLSVALTGVKNLKLATYADVEIRSGTLYRRTVYAGVPVWFDLGTRRRADTVRITWPNGLIQHETDVPAGRPLKVKEAQRLSESCPMVYTWNGRRLEFITDVLGVAPLGASSGDGRHFPVQHREYVRIPMESIAPKDGRYEVRLVEELREVAYIDQVQLIAVDHESGLDVYTNDKFKSPPFSEFRLFGVSRPLPPVSAVDQAGRDERAALSASDGVYAGRFRREATGVAEMHSLTLDFGSAAPGNRAVLYLQGWVDWPDGSTFLAASQSGAGLVLPYLQVKDAAGEWKTAIGDMGLPSGKPKTIAVDLTGRFLSASREVRIVTNLCVYWDRIFLGEDSAPPAVRMTPLDAATAELRLRGFTRPTPDPARRHPELFDYARWTPSAPWNQTAGRYTRYGSVSELTRSPDDRLVIMGSGDELRLEFPAAALPPLTPGQSRDFLLLVDGWAKDADANTAFSQTVEPLPFHAMSSYPYPASERFPDDAGHRDYRARYNTRPALRFVAPLR